LLQRGTSQQQEKLVTEDGAFNTEAVARAIVQLQRNSDEATSQSRANPFLSGHLFQAVPVQGPRLVGSVAQLPSTVDLWPGYYYFDSTVGRPLFLQLATNQWIDGTGAVVAGSTAGTQTYTQVEHGFGTPIIGFLVTNIAGGVVGPVRYIPFGDARDKSIARFLIPQNTITTLTADVYLFH
jgi:hypothetical protein